MILYMPRLVKYITFNFARAITLYPFILLRYRQDEKDQRLINHEKIHLRQQLELLVLLFYLWYLLEYLVGRIKGQGHYQSYRNISFEREAYTHEADNTYLQQRPAFAFFRREGIQSASDGRCS